MAMKTYIAYSHSERGGDRRLDAVLVPDGFRPWAALFGPFWAAGHRLWTEAFGILAAWLIFEAFLAAGGVGVPMTALADVGLILVMGYAASPIQQWALERRGYALLDIVVAEDELAAVRRLFDRDGPAVAETRL